MVRTWVCIILVISIFSYLESSSDAEKLHFKFEEIASVDHQYHISTYISKVFCNIRTIFMNISIEKHVPFAFFDRIIRALNRCTSSGIFLHGYDSSKQQELDVNPYERENIGIELYSLNILRNSQDLNLSYVKKKMKNKEYTYYAIVFTEKLTSESVDIELKAIFNQFWQRQVLNVIIVFWTDKLNCFTYSPFDKKLISLNVSEIRVERLFYDKTKNLNGHKLRMGMFFEPQRAEFHEINGKTIMDGVDAKFGEMVAKKMNATFKLIEPQDGCSIGEMYPNKTTTGVFALLQNETVDMSFNARFFRMQQFFGIIEPTLSIGRDDLCFLVPRSGFTLDLNNIFDAFEIPVWILIIVALPVYAIFFYIYNTIQPCKSYSFDHVVLRLFGWNLNQPYMRSPHTLLAKIILGLWIIYSAVITQWYNSNLTSYLMVKSRLPDITTLHQLEQSNYHILTLQKYADLMNDSLMKSKKYEHLMGRIHAVSHTSEIVYNVGQKNVSYAYAHKDHIFRNILNKHNLFDTFLQMPECPVPFLNVYALAYGSPYKGRVNWILGQYQDCGLLDRLNDMKLHMEKLIQNRHRKSTNEHDVPISISHLQLAFYILVFGCIVSFFVFLFEIYVAKRRS
ncbi:uncharacterized protein LOC116348929 [Contarinia nasturtii]|uniref:uncharacterized protein LOC116348929 n=1 Tax=Contarinia nasturtii TaxID=265458 RepID=UPI0012D47431|nr:uncharacterized protein LOC116348929 [Contarinia nasturtii]